jgi:phosphatidylserine decarboxylase
LIYAQDASWNYLKRRLSILHNLDFIRHDTLLTSPPMNQYVDRETGNVCSEQPFGDWLVNYFYSPKREHPQFVFKLLASRWFSRFLGRVNFDFPLGSNISGITRYLDRCAVDLRECVDTPRALDTARKVFERQIRYWLYRPMSESPGSIVSPADARVLIGSLKESSSLFVKEKFFEYEELLGTHRKIWPQAFRHGDYVICRLTPEKYHYNHAPASGVVRDFYLTDGQYHSCNPTAVLTLASPFSKNKRAVTIIDTDVFGGTGVGLVAMVEIVALMIGEIVQRYSEAKYQNPQPIETGMFLTRGCPKSLFRPGSSTTVLLFQEGRVEFCADLIRNLYRNDIASRYSLGLGRPLVETDIKVRSTIGHRKGGLR